MTGLRMFFSNNPSTPDTFEVAGTNGNGFINNFALGTLELGPGNVKLVDAFDNNNSDFLGDEVLYVSHLILGLGSILDLNHLFLIYGDFQNNGGTLMNAEHLSAVPLPGSAWLLLSGLAGLGIWGRRNKGKHR
jgi:hypothetical protein